MIDKDLLLRTIEDAIANTDMFVVDVRVTPTNEITVEIDSVEGIDIDTCAAITRRIEEVFDRDVEDYQLEVGSAGLTAPFKVRGQYLKNIGNEVQVLTRDGRKLKGILTDVADDGLFTIEIPVKVKPEGAKRPVIEMQPQVFNPADCKSVAYVINFK